MIIIEALDVSSSGSNDCCLLMQGTYSCCNSDSTTAKFGWDDFPIVGRSCCYPQLPYELSYRSIVDDCDDNAYNETRTKKNNAASAAMVTTTAPPIIIDSCARNGEEIDHRRQEMKHGGAKKVIPLTVHPAKVQRFATFGWNDFPIITTPTCINNFEQRKKLDHYYCSNKGFSIKESMESRTERIAIKAPIDRSPYINRLDCFNKTKKNVRFSPDNHILEQIRYYNIILGDHPLCESYPISFGWKYHDEPATIPNVDNAPLINDAVRKSDQYDQHDSESTFNPLRNGISCSKSNCRRIPIQERRQRLSYSMGITADQLDDLESMRQLSMLFL